MRNPLEGRVSKCLPHTGLTVPQLPALLMTVLPDREILFLLRDKGSSWDRFLL